MEGGSVWWRRTSAAVAMLTVGLGPTIFLMVAFNYESLSGPTAFALFGVTTLCTLAAYFLSQTYLRPTQHAALTQTEDVESGQGDVDGPEDAPPIYEVVVAKPPPYEYLYGSSQASSYGKENAEAMVRMSDGCTDSDLPTYSQVAQTPSPV